MYKNYFRYLFFSVLFFVCLNIVFRIAVTDNPNFNIYDLCLNLLSEFAGMIFTVLVFNEFVMYRQRLASFSRTIQLLEELKEFLESINYTFLMPLKECTTQEVDNIWSQETFDIIREKIIVSDMNKNVFPNITWYLFFALQGEKILKKCENIKMQYDDILDPTVSSRLFYLINDSEMLTNLSNIKKIYQTDLITNYNRQTNLGSYFSCPTDKDLNCIAELNKWFLGTKNTIQKSAVIKQKLKRFYKIGYPAIILVLSLIAYMFNKGEVANILLSTLAIYYGLIFITKFWRRM